MIDINIKIVVYGQVVGTGGSDDTTFAFTYPTPNAWLNNEPWLASLFDPRDARNFSESDVYVFWSNQEGNYYAIIFPSSDGRNGRLMLAINVNGVSTDGAVVKSTLDALKIHYVSSKGSMESTTVEYYLKEFKGMLAPNDSFTNSSSGQKGYRVFETTENLTLFLTYPHQKEYEACRCVYFVPTKPREADSNFTQLTTPIKVKYKIGIPPEGVSVSPTSTISAGETIVITYRKQNCQDVRREVTVGENSSYSLIEYNGDRITVKTAEEAGIQFDKQVKLYFKDKESKNEVSSVEVLFKGGSYADNQIRFPESTQEVPIMVNKAGYEKVNYTITREDMNKGSVTIELTPQISKKDINIKWSDGETSKIKVEFKESDRRLLEYLRENSNIIRIDDGKPNNKQSNNIHRDEKKQPKRFWSNIPIWLWMLLVTLVVVSLIKVILYWAPWEQKNIYIDNPSQDIVADTVDSEQDAISNADLDSDIMYLKRSDFWTEDNLKTDDCKQLVLYIKEGSYKKAIDLSNTLFTDKAREKVNGHWNTIVDLINNMPATVSEKDITEAFKRRSSDGKVDLNQLVVELKTMNSKTQSAGTTNTTGKGNATTGKGGTGSSSSPNAGSNASKGSGINPDKKNDGRPRS